MRTFFKEFFDYSEVWALLIPLFFLARRKTPLPSHLKPIKVYVIIALLINIGIILIWKRNKLGLDLPDTLHSNNFLYNFFSIVRLYLFSWFFILLGQRFMHRVKIFIPIAFTIFFLINFIFYEDFFNYWMLSSRLLATESALLLFFCLQYFFFLLLEDRPASLRKYPGFWVVAGLSIYMAVSFFVFLFFNYMIKNNIQFAISIWDVHNVAFIIFCIFIARAFSTKYE